MSKQQFNLTAIIYDKKGRILSIGKNSYVKTHPKMKYYSEKCGRPDAIYLHAEIHAIVKCKNIEKAHKIVVFRYGKNGEPLMAKPCPICQAAIDDLNIPVVEWTC